MKYSFLTTMLALFGVCYISYCQSISSRLLDVQTKEPIPFASILYGEEQGVITNENGDFQFVIEQNTKALDSIYISCMGYVGQGFTQKQLQDSIIYLAPGGFELVGVDLMGQGLSADEIIQRMVDSIPVNYNQMPVQKKFFLRQSTYDELDEAKIVLKASTIPEIDDISIERIVDRLPKKTQYHTETFGNMYKSNGKVKLEVLKATEMYDKSQQATYAGINHSLIKLIKKHVKDDSYFKIKTGPISTKLDLDTIIGRPSLDPQAETSIKLNYLASRANRLNKIENQFFNVNSRLEVIEKRKNYQFTKDQTFEQDGERFYVINFGPKKNARLRGKMFINANDFAMTRIEYENLESIKPFKLLGVNYNEPKYVGVAEFDKMKNGKYELSFSTLKHDFFVKVRRPFKIAEKNKNTKGRRKQNEITIDLYLTAKSANVFEWVALETKGSSQGTFDMVPQRQIVEVKYRTSYDEQYWEDVTIVSPSESVKEFAILENE
ncbi:carboxypeptidase-like regulatory domain-containing protein [Croceivirga thetidis]|uniref:Carboxypeptidase-like regulatory domain-containing protein n=1 Tax=Croceivirga thetidis TaxID=2721623 RepID=A0ABX1GWC9_9FLAO|nr:carboxypeptidase-like regulatory domain-containing protein [Croceivirga thetidis]NKI33195.1 carboxypeptidase-like regulatory domain-containing protein [Croceivirga thetidis]